jgi:hypothetical protein
VALQRDYSFLPVVAENHKSADVSIGAKLR